MTRRGLGHARAGRRTTRTTGRRRIGRALLALLGGCCLGIGLRLALFFGATLVVRGLAAAAGLVLPLLPSVDPVYSRTAVDSLGNLHIQGLASANFALLRLVVRPGSALLARLVAAGLAHAALLGIGLAIVRDGWLRRSTPRVLVGLAVQAQVAVGILGARPSAGELESTGLAFAANALLPWLWQRSQALTDGLAGVPSPLLAALLVGLALVVAYVPASLVLLLRRSRARTLTFGTALAVVLTSAACAGVLAPEASGPPSGPAISPPVSAPVSAPAVVVERPSPAPPAPTVTAAPPIAFASDRWFLGAPEADAPSRVQVEHADGQYRLLVNGQPLVIQGMGLNTQYAQQLAPDARAARLEADMAALQQLGVNTVLGWDPAEFDDTLLAAAQRHGIGVIMPFDLDPEADYTDPQLRQTLHDQVLAWVARYRAAPALRMWGLGNEVLHKIVHPAWVGPQDPARERNAEAFSDWLVETADAIHAVDPDHPVTYRSAEDAFVDWVAAALQRRGGGPRPWFVWGTNCYQDYLSRIVDNWPDSGLDAALWVSEFAPGTLPVPDRPEGFRAMWAAIRRHPEWVLGGAVYAWTRNGPEGVDRNFGLTDDGVPVDGRSLDMLGILFHQE